MAKSQKKNQFQITPKCIWPMSGGILARWKKCPDFASQDCELSIQSVSL